MLGLVGDDGGVQFIRSAMDNAAAAAAFHHQQQQNNNNNTNANNNNSSNSNNNNSQQQQQPQPHMQQSQTLILPISMPGDKPGDVQQTVQIQVLNPNQIQQAPKFQMHGQMQIPLQGFQQPTVVTVAVPQDGELMPNHGLHEGMTVLAAIQPQDLQLFAQTSQQMQQHIQQQQQQQQQMNGQTIDLIKEESDNKYVKNKYF